MSTDNRTITRDPAMTHSTARARILAAAATLFATKGADQVTVREISALARSSNATLVKHFGSKDGLFAAFVADAGRQMREGVDVEPSQSAEVALTEIARHLVTMYIPMLKAYRATMAAINSDPRFGALVYEETQRSVIERLALRLQRWTEEGALAVTDFTGDADRFLQIIQAGVWKRNFYALQADASQAEIDEAARGAVRVFLHGVASK